MRRVFKRPSHILSEIDRVTVERAKEPNFNHFSFFDAPLSRGENEKYEYYISCFENSSENLKRALKKYQIILSFVRENKNKEERANWGSLETKQRQFESVSNFFSIVFILKSFLKSCCPKKKEKKKK